MGDLGLTDLMDSFWIPEFSEGFGTTGTIWFQGKFNIEDEDQLIAAEILNSKTMDIYSHTPKCNLIRAEVAFVDGCVQKVFPKPNSKTKLILKYKGNKPYHEEVPILVD